MNIFCCFSAIRRILGEERLGCCEHFRWADLEQAEGLAASLFQAGGAGRRFGDRKSAGGGKRAAELGIRGCVERDDGAVERAGEMDGTCVIRDEQIHSLEKRCKRAEGRSCLIQMRARDLGGDLFRQKFFFRIACDEDFASGFFFQAAPQFDEVGGGPSLKSVFRSRMKRDPPFLSFGKPFRVEKGERKIFRVSFGADCFRDFKPAHNFVFGKIVERMGEKRVESFIDAGGGDDASCSDQRAKGEGGPLRGVEQKDCIVALLAELFPEREHFSEQMDSIEMRVMAEEFESDRAGEEREIGVRECPPEVFDCRRGPEGVSEGGGGDDEDSVCGRVYRDEFLEKPDNR